MKLWYQLNKYLLLAALVALPAAFLFQEYRFRKFMEAQELAGMAPMNCSFIGILYALQMFTFLYLIPFLIWNFALKAHLKNHWSTYLQLSIIFLIGVLPGMFISLMGFIAK